MVLMTKRKGTMFFATFFAKTNWLPCTKNNAIMIESVISVTGILGILLAEMYVDEALKEKGEVWNLFINQYCWMR